MRFSTLNELLQQRAEQNTEEIAYTFLPNGEDKEHSITYGELDLRARAVAAYLQICTRPGERALLLFPSGLEYIIALMGCFYSGIIAVPAYPPKPVCGNRRNARIQSILEDARPSVVMTTTAWLCRAKQSIAACGAARQIRWVATDIVAESWHSAWKDPAVGGGDIAFLQYTSGSTSTPKGVMLSHGNILHNERMIETAWWQNSSSTVVGWLPLYHDMGLIGNVLQPLYLGARSILMPPTAFLQRPVRWLQAISRYGGKTSGGPNFAYDLCARKVTASEKEKLDLSNWTVAFNGAEPVRKETLERFTAAFECCGFRSSAFYPCYGLAEASLMVSGGATSDGPVVRHVSARAPEKGRVEEGSETEPSRRDFVGCGQPAVNTRVVIVNPETCNPVEEGELGEVWVLSPAVACGYWNQSETTEKLFRARLHNGMEGEYLRTRDLGFIHEGELFIAGRLQDLIIIRGQNHHPEDIEWAIRQTCNTVAIGAVAAFSIDKQDEQDVVVLMEVDHHGRLEGEEIAKVVRRAVAEQHDIQIRAIGLVKSRALAKTSSGKIQRHVCKQQYLSGSLELLYHSVLAGSSYEPPPMTLSRESVVGTPESESRTLLEVYLEEQVCRLARLGEADVCAPLIGLGLDSTMMVQLKSIIERELAINLELESLLDGASIRNVARFIVKRIREECTVRRTQHAV